MKNTTLVRRVSTLFFTLTFATLAWSQAALKPLTLDEQVSHSDAIVEGKVISKASFWNADRTNIYTVNTVEVYKSFKGEVQPTIEIITSGGTVDLEMEIVSPSLSLQTNSIGVFFLNNSSQQLQRSSTLPAYRSHSSVQGFYQYDIETDRAVSAVERIDGITTTLYQELQNKTGRQLQSLNDFNPDTKRASMATTNSRSAIAVTNISPMVATAGTKTTITITGSGFGTVMGDVGFSNSDYGGMLYYDALESQIMSWSDTEIVVEVPDKAGTGAIRIRHDDTSTQVSGQSLTVEYAHSNAEYTPTPGTTQYAYFLQHVDTDGNGGYEWQMQTDFDANTAANDAFVRSLDTWRCNSKINWTVGSPTTVDVIASDGVNVVRFDNGAELPGGVLGRCTSRFSGCFDGSGGIDWYVTELDIAFDDTANWNFSTSAPTASQYDFETVSVHELGHGHQLGHVIDSNTIMHYSVSNGVAKRNLDQNDIDGGNELQARSTSSQVCSEPLMTNFASCSLGTEDNVLAEGISLYPNPASDFINLSNNSPITIESVEIIDINGRIIQSIQLDTSYGVQRISVNQMRSGIYFFRIQGENAIATKKIIIN
ncbi:T9SS type A sorting domain-containing protein [Winogradskyella sp. A3E31]|uniref:T9SS type A sorting domain-containing protein n=1 Tax=Winogradskyella sp. A3E31 TaxID=3349637 RepID=UPI00398B9ED3